MGREQQDVGRAQESLEVLQQREADLEAELTREVDALREKYDPATAKIEASAVAARKSDIEVQSIGLLWWCS
jgi:hypothetical protein